MRYTVQIILLLVLTLCSSLAQAANVNLAWDASVSAGVTGYRIHYGIAAGAYSNVFEAGNQLTASVPNLTAGQQYFFAATAYDAVGGQSPYSNEVAHTVPTPPPVQGGLVAAYSFENGSGTILTDVSGFGNHGAIAGPTWTTLGRFGNALNFDGGNDWVTVADSPSLALTTAMTLEAWVYPALSQSGKRTIIQKRVDAYVLHASSASALFPAGGGRVSGAVVYTTDTSALPVNAWSHLAVTYDGSTIRLYTNGTLVSSLAATGLLEVNTQPLRIGGNNTFPNEYFLGRIDEMRIYNRALTAAEIQTDMQTPVIPTTAVPVANFTGTPTTGVAPLAVTFSNTTTGSATSWSWDLGDGTTSTAQQPSHTYTTAGVHTVALTATGPGGSHTATKPNYIATTVPPPVANFTGTPTTGDAPLAVTFTDTTTGAATSWLWDFGDGTTSTVQHPSHSYAVVGTYTVELTATGPGGAHTATKANYVTATVLAPVADFTGAPTMGSVPLIVTFADTTTGTATSWNWDFGDGSTSTVQHPIRTYTTAGVYTVSLTATGPGGSHTATKTQYVTATAPVPPVAPTALRVVPQP